MKILKNQEYPDQDQNWHDGFAEGVRSVLAIRCIHHREAPLANRNETCGAECPVCEYQILREEINLLLQAAAPSVIARFKTATERNHRLADALDENKRLKAELDEARK